MTSSDFENFQKICDLLDPELNCKLALATESKPRPDLSKEDLSNQYPYNNQRLVMQLLESITSDKPARVRLDLINTLINEYEYQMRIWHLGLNFTDDLTMQKWAEFTVEIVDPSFESWEQVPYYYLLTLSSFYRTTIEEFYNLQHNYSVELLFKVSNNEVTYLPSDVKRLKSFSSSLQSGTAALLGRLLIQKGVFIPLEGNAKHIANAISYLTNYRPENIRRYLGKTYQLEDIPTNTEQLRTLTKILNDVIVEILNMNNTQQPDFPLSHPHKM